MIGWLSQLPLVFERGARPCCSCAPPEPAEALDAAALNVLTTGIEIPEGSLLFLPEREPDRREF